MGCKSLDSLYLFEFMVDTVHINNLNCLPIKDTSQADLCVRFQFLSIHELDILPSEKCPVQAGDVPFKAGKSCLFSLQAPHTINKLCVNVFLIQKKQSCPMEEPGFVGQACVPLPSFFLDLFKDTKCSSSKQMRSTAILTNCSGAEVGCAKLFIRLSSFGGSIVTQFQDTENGKESFYFKGMQKGSETTVGTSCGRTERGSAAACTSRGDANLLTACSNEGSFGQRKGTMGGDTCRKCGGNQSGSFNSESGNGDDSDDEAEGFSIIKAEVNGHALKIKIPKRQKKDGEDDGCPVQVLS